MNVQKPTLRGSICVAAVSLAMLPAAAMAQDSNQYGTNQTTQAAQPTQADQAYQTNQSSQQYPASQQSSLQAGDRMQSSTGMNAQGYSGSTGASGSQGAQASQGKGTQPNVAGVVTYVLVPIAHPSQQQMKQKGCWVSLYGKQNFAGDTLSLMGPVDMPNMVGPFGIDWKGKIRSLETGPKATLRVYDNENFRDPVSTFKPGTRTADISKRLGFFDEMSSLQISCPK